MIGKSSWLAPALGALAVLAHPASAMSQGLNAVFTDDGYDVWAVGDAGEILRSLDTGVTWASYPLGAADHHGVAARGGRVLITDDDGTIWRSADGGYSFSSQAPVPSVALHSVWLDEGGAAAWAAGAAGTILKSADGGESWFAVASGVGATLNVIRFSGLSDGWACGAGGIVLHSTDGGESWLPVTGFPPSGDLYDVDIIGDRISIAGAGAFLCLSTDGGNAWSSIDLAIESRSDVNGVDLLLDGSLWLCGGGGFLRKTQDDGLSFSYPLHPIVTGLADVFFLDTSRGWACAARSKNVARTTDGGATWSVPGGAGSTLAWTQVISSGSASIRGNTFQIDPNDRKKLYCVQGKSVQASWDLGTSWTTIATIAGSGTRTNAFLVSQKDTLTWLALVQDSDRVTRTTNGGATWTPTISIGFTEYGLPLERDCNNPDHVWFGPEDGQVWKSTDFGATWFVHSDPNFRSPDDFVVVKDTSGVILVSDGVTGSGNAQIWKTSDDGATWVVKKTVAGSEVPTIGGSWLDPALAYATNWSSGGVQRTTNMGESWPNVASTASAWGVDIAKDDPNVVIYSVYSGNKTYLSTNGGQSFQQASLSGSNYGLLAYDRGTFLAHQSGGVWKAAITQPPMPVNNQQLLTLLAPNGGEAWEYNQPHAVNWLTQNIASVKLEYRSSSSGPWEVISPSTSGPAATYSWVIPDAPTAAASLRVSDADDGAPSDESDAPFEIVVAAIAVVQPSLDFGDVAIGDSRADTLRVVNAGTATLVVSSVTVTGAGPFTPSRTSFSVPAGSSDTLAVVFEPAAQGSHTDTLVIASNAPGTPARVPLRGAGVLPVGVPTPGDEGARGFALLDNAPNPFGGLGTVIGYALAGECDVRLAVYNALGQEVATLVEGRQSAGRYAVRFPGARHTLETGLAGTLASGVYFYRLEAGGRVETKQMVLVR